MKLSIRILVTFHGVLVSMLLLQSLPLSCQFYFYYFLHQAKAPLATTVTADPRNATKIYSLLFVCMLSIRFRSWGVLVYLIFFASSNFLPPWRNKQRGDPATIIQRHVHFRNIRFDVSWPSLPKTKYLSRNRSETKDLRFMSNSQSWRSPKSAIKLCRRFARISSSTYVLRWWWGR